MVKYPQKNNLKINENKFGVSNYSYYICVLLITNTIIMSEKLKIQSSIVPTERPSFNEWVQEKNVSGLYLEPTEYYRGNSTTIGMMYIKKEPTLLSKFIKFFSI